MSKINLFFKKILTIFVKKEEDMKQPVKDEEKKLFDNIHGILSNKKDAVSFDEITQLLYENNIELPYSPIELEEQLITHRSEFGLQRSSAGNFKVKAHKRNTGKDPFYTEKHYEQYKLSGDKNFMNHLIDSIITDLFKDDEKFMKLYNKVSVKNPHKLRELLVSRLDYMLFINDDDIKNPKIENIKKADKQIYLDNVKNKMFSPQKVLSDMNVLKDMYVPKSEHIEEVITKLKEYISYGMANNELIKKYSKNAKFKAKYKDHQIFKSSEFGEIPTPIKICERILDKWDKEDGCIWKDPYIKYIDRAAGTGPFLAIIIKRLLKGLKDYNKDGLDLRVEEIRYKWIIENMIYAAEIQAKNILLWMWFVDPYDQYKLNVYYGDSLSKDFDKFLSEVWNIKSDKNVREICNPPYNDMIDLYFLKKSCNTAEEVLFIHPATWLIDEKNKQAKYTSAKEVVKNSLYSIELLNGNQLFGINLFVPLTITHIIKNKNTKGILCIDNINDKTITYDNIGDINKFSNIDIYPSLKDKILTACGKDNIDNHKIFNTSTKRNSTAGKISKHKHLNTIDEYYINIAQIRGNVNKKSDNPKMVEDDFYTILTRDNAVQRVIDNHMFWKFDNEISANNFHNYLKTNFCRFCLSIYKNNSQLECGEMSLIPWLDFNQSWTDAQLIYLFNFSADEVNLINKFIPKYY